MAEDQAEQGHSHCWSCFQARCTVNDCPVESCPSGCGTALHLCKVEEHILHTCPASPVPCLNASHGCEMVLPRAKLAHHLKICPASVVQCSFSYDRYAVETHVSDARPSEIAYTQDNTLLLDERCLLADANLAQQEGKCVRVKCGQVDSNDKEGPQAAELDMECQTGSDINASSKSIFTGNLPAPRSKICIDATVTSYSYFSNSNVSTKHFFTFPCNEIVRRDEFANHWKDCHIDIRTSMPSIIHRCPMRKYGCKHGEVWMTPDPNGASLDFMDEAHCIALKLPHLVTDESGTATDTLQGEYAQQLQKKQELSYYGYDEEDSFDVLSQLPAEVLMKICDRLDSLGLWNLSQVNRYIREVCFNLVKKRGILYRTWQKNDTTKKWEQGEKRWSFSRVFEGISSWSFTDSPAVCAHLASCPILHTFAKSYDPTTPWKLSGLGQSLHKRPEISSHQKSPSYGGSGLFSETSSEDEIQLQD